MVQNGILKPFLESLDSEDPMSIGVSLMGISCILNRGAHFAENNNFSENPFLKDLVEVNGIEEIKKLQESHPDLNVRRKALDILEKFRIS